MALKQRVANAPDYEKEKKWLDGGWSARVLNYNQLPKIYVSREEESLEDITLEDKPERHISYPSLGESSEEQVLRLLRRSLPSSKGLVVASRVKWDRGHSYKFIKEKTGGLVGRATGFEGTIDPMFRESMPKKFKNIVVHHSAGRGSLDGGISRTHQKRGWGDIGYHYIIPQNIESVQGKKVNVLEGRSINFQGSHAGKSLRGENNNVRSIGIVLVGNFHPFGPLNLSGGGKPTRGQLFALNKLIKYFKVRSKKLGVVGHRDVKKTNCPGDHLYGKWIK